MKRRPTPAEKSGETRSKYASNAIRVKTIEKYLKLGYPPLGVSTGSVRSSVMEAARELKMPLNLINKQIHRGVLKVDWSLYKPAEPTNTGPKLPPRDLGAEIMRVLLKRAATIETLAGTLKAQEHEVRAALGLLKDNGVSLYEIGGNVYHILPPQEARIYGPSVTIMSRPDNTFLFGACGDNHIGSRYARQDVLSDLYDRYEKAKVQAVFNTGNWIDGEARFNKHELEVHGMDGQLRHLAKHYPGRKGINTYAVAGDDHEGWYSQREGVDIGRYAEMKMRDAGRDDWHNLGYMEAHIKLTNANTGAHAILAVVHPGGGSSYATSYSVQKIIESLDGGEKPAVAFYGHYHKLWAGNIRNVWVVQTGTTQDQSSFMRKKKLEAHVGGTIVGLEQDPKTGAIIACTPQLIRYFVREYYQDRWNMHGSVQTPMRSI
jgi:hypothetical protein